MRERPAREWLSLLEPSGVPCGPINDLAQVFADPQVRHRGMEVRAAHPVAGEVRMVANPMKLQGDPITHASAPPLLGQHTDDVLRSVLGLDAAAIERLRAERVI
jgi:crotonobetainyl-CoA:carnitine CoA-transferase CaiB-like acyl-CoA transferase